MNKNKKEIILEQIIESFSTRVEYIAAYDYDFESLDMDNLKDLYNFFNDVKDLIFDQERKEIKKI